MRTLNLLHRTIPWLRNRRHSTSDSLAIVDEGPGDDRALNSGHFDGVDYDPVDDAD